jgi:hypothetical protein
VALDLRSVHALAVPRGYGLDPWTGRGVEYLLHHLRVAGRWSASQVCESGQAEGREHAAAMSRAAQWAASHQA